ncbi:MAG: RIP metalloprotease RseP, partial [Candidatus Cloacimonetes bacterium]|nr:RIP metalloprotease RseP [Candidatus Cloacimonadota bacterium]
MLSILLVILALSVIITVHEFGHFIAALLFGVTVERFSIGFGPRLFTFTIKGIEFRISLILLGGYVKMKGEYNGDEHTGESGEFLSKRWWQKALIAFNGPFVNFLFAILLFILSFLIGTSYRDSKPVIGVVDSTYAGYFEVDDKVLEVNGEPVRSWTDVGLKFRQNSQNIFTIKRNGLRKKILLDTVTVSGLFSGVLPHAEAVVGEVVAGMPAYEAGLMIGDRILLVDSVAVKDWYHMRSLIVDNPGESVIVQVQRDGNTFNKEIHLNRNILSNNEKIIGITQNQPIIITERYGIGESIQLGFVSTMNLIGYTYSGLYKLLLNPDTLLENVASPV